MCTYLQAGWRSKKHRVLWVGIWGQEAWLTIRTSEKTSLFSVSFLLLVKYDAELER